MGYNTTIVIHNDALDIIRQDPEFGAKLVDSIINRKSGKTSTINASTDKVSTNAGVVVETHHSSYDVLVRVRGNTGEVVE